MENKKKTAWYDDKTLPQEMVNGATGKNGWIRLEYTDHYVNLNGLIELANAKDIADIGCGAGELGRVKPNHRYVGFDLPHIINKVSKVVNPDLAYIEFDCYESDFSLFKDFDLLVCNGFISELTNPLLILEKLLDNTTNCLVIHRQLFSNKTELNNYKTYGGLDTPRSYIGYEDFNKLLINHEVIKTITSNYGNSILIKRK